MEIIKGEKELRSHFSDLVRWATQQEACTTANMLQSGMLAEGGNRKLVGPAVPREDDNLAVM